MPVVHPRPPYIDVSPRVWEKTAVFPGDEPYQRQTKLSFELGHSLLLSGISGSVHLGAHADAPNHYHPNGVGIDQRSLIPYLGLCQVITVKKKPGERILPSDLPAESWPKLPPRVLFRTSSFPDPDHWNSDFNSLSPELIQSLADRGVRLVGIDTPSVDPADSKKLESHQSIYENDLSILEGLVLDDAPDGLYTLIALPLRLVDADASPVRAILVPIQDGYPPEWAFPWK